jgi:hypothetical protein
MSRKTSKLIAALPAFRSIRIDFEAGVEGIGVVVDRLGKVKAAIASLVVYKDALEAILIENGATPVEGQLFRAVVVPGGEGVRLDTKAIRAKKGDKWCAEFEVPTERSPSVRVTARTGVDLVVAAE